VGAAPAHPAATVLLLRDRPGGVEVYLQRRPRRFGFAGGLWVYPGGRVDGADRDPAIDGHWAGPSPDAWAHRLGVRVDDARGYVVAACREMLEEAGVLLAWPAARPRDLAIARRDLLSGARNLAQVVGDLDVRVDTSLLRYWAWWVTPEAEPRRFDTRFFVARLPAGAAVTPHEREVVEEMWAHAPVGGAMLPPTHHTLREVGAFGSSAAVLKAGAQRRVDRVLPMVDGREIVLPWGERHPLPRGI
jgi:8-oxo-dGTP pyrophosphatase MutT (NUDIX family)